MCVCVCVCVCVFLPICVFLSVCCPALSVAAAVVWCSAGDEFAVPLCPSSVPAFCALPFSH